jgi:hypothetical protein
VSEAEHEHANTRAEEVGVGQEPPPREWAVPRVVPHGPRRRCRLRRWWLGPWLAVPVLWPERRGYCTCLVGKCGTGRSYVLLDLGVALLTGHPWLGLAVAKVKRVLYVDAELDLDTMKLRAWEVARGRGLERLPLLKARRDAKRDAERTAVAAAVVRALRASPEVAGTA